MDDDPMSSRTKGVRLLLLDDQGIISFILYGRGDKKKDESEMSCSYSTIKGSSVFYFDFVMGEGETVVI